MSLRALNGSVALAYEERGAGTPVLLVHGLGYTRGGWGPAADLLEKRFGLLLMDNRGMGESDKPPGPYTVAELAADAAAVLAAAGLERAHVLGTSLGGMVAQELAIGWPERVARLVLVCTTAGGASAYPMPERTVRLFGEVPGLEPEVALRRMAENSLADATVRARPELVEQIYAYRLVNRPDLAAWAAQAAAGAAFDSRDRLGGIRAPTLVLTGTADNVIDHRNSELLAQGIAGARLEHFHGGGHLFLWEEPERFAATVGDFLAAGGA